MGEFLLSAYSFGYNKNVIHIQQEAEKHFIFSVCQ